MKLVTARFKSGGLHEKYVVTCAINCQNCTVYSVFPSGMTSRSKIAQFNRACRGRLSVYQFQKQPFVLFSLRVQRIRTA